MATTSVSEESLVFPDIHQFPPFYTRQPTDATRTRQLELCELCVNRAIQRQLSRDLLLEIIDTCVNKGDAEWLDTSKTELFIYWRRPDAWAQLIYNWIVVSGQRGSVLTLYELSNSTMVQGQEFYKLDDRMLRKSLKTLTSKGKAQVFSSGAGEDGVKFF
ncbi:vacuolar protein sorting 25 [Syncephalis plumigaleata]|nr:vacuolar protein sorting 25 [Syncephalis plumigaleata]